MSPEFPINGHYQSVTSRAGLVFSIIIPNYNGAALIGECLDSIAAQTLKPQEVIVVDDCSSDNSVSFIALNYPRVRQIVRKENGGFAAASNTGLNAARGDIQVLFNNDAVAEPGWLEAIDRAFAENPDFDSIASKILLYDRRDTFHAAGDYYRKDGVPGNRGVWEKDTGQYNKPEEVFGACAAAAAYRRKALVEIRTDTWDGNVFDEALFMYLEDVDLNLRLRLRGKRCLYVPDAVVYHHLSATKASKLASYQCGRNFLLVAVKNLPKETLKANIWPILKTQLGYTKFSLRYIKLDTERARLRGQLAAMRALPKFLRSRKRVQATRQISSDRFEALLTEHPAKN